MEQIPVFDLTQLLQSACDDRETASAVVALFLEEVPTQLAQLDRALAAGDSPTAERMAHSIKGSSAAIGGLMLRDVAFRGEKLGREGKLDDLRLLLPELRQCFDDLSCQLRSLDFQL